MGKTRKYTVVVPLKLLSLNEYVNLCRGNRFAAARYKEDIEKAITKYLSNLPKFNNPIHISFIWVEANKRRDLDNICYAKKHILDALVKSGKLKDDSRKYVVGFTDSFQYANTFQVILEIKEME